MGSYILAGFFVMGVSAYHLLRRQHLEVFERSFRMGVWFALIFALLEGATGHVSAVDVAHKQPAKLAAMESLWQGGANRPMVLAVVPDPKNERNAVEIGKIPSALSLLVHGRADGEIQGLGDFAPQDRPPVTLVFVAFRVMVALGTLFIVIAAIGWLWRRRIAEHPRYLRVVLWMIPLPYIAIQAGWVVTEVGRQPWIVYGVMRTQDAVSPIAVSQVAVSLAAFVVVYGILGVVNFLLLARLARRGPETTGGA